MGCLQLAILTQQTFYSCLYIFFATCLKQKSITRWRCWSLLIFLLLFLLFEFEQVSYLTSLYFQKEYYKFTITIVPCIHLMQLLQNYVKQLYRVNLVTIVIEHSHNRIKVFDQYFEHNCKRGK